MDNGFYTAVKGLNVEQSKRLEETYRISFDARQELELVSKFDSYDSLRSEYDKHLKLKGTEVGTATWNSDKKDYDYHNEKMFIKNIEMLVGKYVDENGFLEPYVLVITVLS